MEVFFNPLLFFLQLFLITSLTLFALKKGKEALQSWCILLSICMNLLVLKQISFFGLTVTCTEGLTIGYLLGFNLTQEFFGRKEAKKMIFLSFFAALSFVLLGQLHLAFRPSPLDTAHVHYAAIFSVMPRLLLASIASFIVVQFFDLHFFGFLKKKLKDRHLPLRLFCSLGCSQVIDTILFSFLGLFGVVSNILDVILFSIVIKMVIIFSSTLFITFSRRFVRYDSV